MKIIRPLKLKWSKSSTPTSSKVPWCIPKTYLNVNSIIGLAVEFSFSNPKFTAFPSPGSAGNISIRKPISLHLLRKQT